MFVELWIKELKMKQKNKEREIYSDKIYNIKHIYYGIV